MRNLLFSTSLAVLLSMACASHAAVGASRLPKEKASEHALGLLALGSQAACGKLGLSLPEARPKGTGALGGRCAFSLAATAAGMGSEAYGRRTGTSRPAGRDVHPAKDMAAANSIADPETLAMLVAGLALMGFVARRRRADDLS